MDRRILGFLLMLLALAACSQEMPTEPFGPNGTAMNPSKIMEELNAASAKQADGDAFADPPEEDLPKFNNPRDNWKTWLTWNSAYRVDKAAKDYGCDNDGWFATGLDQPNAVGKTLIDYLPGGILMTNAFTGVRTEPSDGAASYQGAIGYLTIYDDDAYPVGYTVTAMGTDTSESLIIEFRTDGRGGQSFPWSTRLGRSP